VPHPEEAPVSYEFILDWYARTCELVTKFSPDVLWFDFGWHRDEFEPWRPRIVAHYYNHALENGYEPVLQYKGKLPDGTAVLDIERGKLDDIRPDYWQTDTSVSYKSWSYIKGDEFRTATSIVHDLVDIVSKNGNLLLNVGPRADGTIPDEVQALLRDTGKWLDVNGEAIYGTRHWEVFGEGPTVVPTVRFRERDYQPFTAQDVRFTTKGDVLYAILMGWPEGQANLKSLASGSDLAGGSVQQVSMLGVEGALSWSQDDQGLKVDLPSERHCDHAYTLKIVLDR
jgi:alpha-L-fucosidase